MSKDANAVEAATRREAFRIEAERLRVNRAKQHVFALQDYADGLKDDELRKSLAAARAHLESADNRLLELWYASRATERRASTMVSQDDVLSAIQSDVLLAAFKDKPELAIKMAHHMAQAADELLSRKDVFPHGPNDLVVVNLLMAKEHLERALKAINAGAGAVRGDGGG